MSQLTREAGRPATRGTDAPSPGSATAEPTADETGGKRESGIARTEGTGRVTVRLFDADRHDRELEVDEALEGKVGNRQLLWMDVEGRPEAQLGSAIFDRLRLRPLTRGLLERNSGGAHIALHGEYLHVRVATAADHDPSEGASWLDVIAAGNLVLTWHEDPVAILNDLDDRIEADATIGQLDAAAFTASAVDAAVTGYFKAVDEIEEVVDRLDTVALAGDPDRDLLTDLVDVRRRISRLRRVLSSQREVFAAFGTPDFRAVVGDDAEAFGGVASRFESALQSVENSRELLLGSFEVFMTRTAQRTNDTMKVLTLVTVLLLPGALIAGLLGMNVEVPLSKDSPLSFWLVVIAIALLACAVLVMARTRRWI
jgi:Mg2+ and Co2+ transporter CorA